MFLCKTVSETSLETLGTSFLGNLGTPKSPLYYLLGDLLRVDFEVILEGSPRGSDRY